DGSLSMTMMKRVMPAMVTIAVLALIARRVPVDRLIASLRDANYVAFLAVMIPNTIVYFLWDTLILKTVVGWFHGGVPFRGLLPIAVAVAAFWLAVFAYTRLHVTPARALTWLFAPREWVLFRTFRRASAVRYGQVVLLRAPMFLVSLAAHYYGAHAFGIDIPFRQMLTVLPVVFMAVAPPITVAHLGTTQAAWLLFFGQFAPAPRLLAFSLVAH